MKRFFVLGLLLLGIFCSRSEAQTADSSIERWHGGFRYVESKKPLCKEDLNQMLDSKMLASYSKAHREHIASIPLWVASGIGVATSAGFAIAGAMDAMNPAPTDADNPVMPAAPFFFAASGAVLAATMLPLVPAVILTIDSRKRLNQIAADYNGKCTSTVKVGFVNQGIGFTLNF